MNPTNHLLLSVILFGMGLTSCARTDINRSSLNKYNKETKKLKTQLVKMNVYDGINIKEADIIARAYFHKYVGCGGYLSVSDGGTFWEVNGLFGLGARRIKGFQIDKMSGKITSPIGPSYLNPKFIFEEEGGGPSRINQHAQPSAESDAGTGRKLAP